MTSRLSGWWRTYRRAALIATAVAGALVTAAVLIWPITDLIAAHDVGQIAGPQRARQLQTAREAVRTQLLTLSAGLFAAGALVYTARNFTLSRRTFELTEQGQVTDRYTKAIEQLGSKELDVRIGGIYALERVAHDSPRDHPTVMEVLAAFIRAHSREQWQRPQSGHASALEHAMRPDIQAALIVLDHGDITRPRQPMDLSGANLSGARLNSADLTGANLTGVDLTSADLTYAQLTIAHLEHAKLRRADLTGARLNGAHLSGADLTEADLSDAHLTDATLTDATLTEAYLSGAHLGAADLTRADLTGAHLPNADLTRARMAPAFLSGSDLSGARLDSTALSGADLTGAFLTSAHMTDAHLRSANLTGAHLAGADLSHAKLTDARLTGADLTGADLTGALLTGAFLDDANLTRANLTRVDFTDAELTGAQWFQEWPVPKGWSYDPGSGRLKRHSPTADDS